MDPHLEGFLWPDVHHELASSIKEILAPQISPKYVARISIYTVSDTHPDEDIGIIYPDVEVLKQKKYLSEPEEVYTTQTPDEYTPITISLPVLSKIEVKIPVVEIRDRNNNQLITAIEILSPVNKRKPGLHQYRKKRKKLYEAGVHLVEIDLIRRGERPIIHPKLPEKDYLMSLIRAGSGKNDVWAIDIKEKLPVIPIPLKGADPDATLDLGKALNLVYDRSLYHLSIDYGELPPPPSFPKEVLKWIKDLVSNTE